MRRRRNSLLPFLGAIQSVDSRAIPSQYAADSNNVRTEDGIIRVRYGYRNLSGPISGFVSTWGLGYVAGYNASYAKVEEFIGIAKNGTANYPYSIHPTTGAFTEIKDGVTSTALHESDWTFVAFDADSYLINPNETYSVFKHVIGDATSLRAVKWPTAQSTALLYGVTLSGGAWYSQIDWTGLDPSSSGEVTCTGAATNTGSALTSGQIVMRHTANTVGETSISIDMADMTAGVADWSYNDAFEFPMSTPVGSSFAIDWDTLSFTFINNDGSPLSVSPSRMYKRTSGTNQWTFSIYFDDKVRANWDNIRNIVIRYNVSTSTGTASNNTLTIQRPLVGDVWMAPIDSIPAASGMLKFGYSYYNSTDGWESDIGAIRQIPLFSARSIQPGDAGVYLGSNLTIGYIASVDATVDKIRIYYYGQDGRWYRQTEVSNGTSTYVYKKTDLEARTGTEYKPQAFRTDKCVSAFRHSGVVVWLYQGGKDNVRFSGVGTALRQAAVQDQVEDLTRGRTMSMSPGLDDEPLRGFSVNNSAVVVGKRGVYASIGDTPYLMGPFLRLPGSFGGCNKLATTEWQDGLGNPGVVAVSADGEGIYFYQVNQAFNGDQGYQITELTKGIRGKFKSFLIAGQSLSDLSTVRLGVDEAQDALWVIAGKRAMVLRRLSVVDNVRQWEFYTYGVDSSETIKYIAFTNQSYRMRWMRSNGKFDENEWNSATNAYIAGTNRDGGNQLPENSIWWRSKTFHGVNRRIDNCYVVNDSDDLQIKIVSTRQTSTEYLDWPNKNVRFSPFQQGEDHYFEIHLVEQSGPIRVFDYDEVGPLSRRVTE